MHKKPDGRKSLGFVVAATLCVLLALLFAFWNAMEQSQREGITMPDGIATEVETPAADAEQEELFLTVAPENVQQVLSAMARPGQYTQTFSVTTHWDGGSDISAVTIWRKGNLMRAEVVAEATTRHLLTDGTTLWLWYGGEEAVAQFQMEDSISFDDLLGVPTYESLTQLPDSAILQGQYLDDGNGGHCIYITASQWATVETAYWVDADSQILVAAEVQSDDTLQLSMSQISLTFDDIEDTVFVTPDGVTLETEMPQR
ncbi:MAG: hypothetical protein R3Y62_01340 [Eubacteriales bacterium]